jgi:hypothetical protein
VIADLLGVTRFELIDHTKPAEEGGGRAFVLYGDGLRINVVLQDEGRTMKVFIDSVQI